MPMPIEAWRSRLLPASFRGVPFKVDGSSFAGGRRTVTHEYPKKDQWDTEDLGLRARRFSVTGYIIGEDYDLVCRQLIDACELPDAGLLVHPYHGERMVRLEAPLGVNHSRDRGRMCEISISFVEAGGNSTATPKKVNTGAAVKSAADALEGQVISDFTGKMNTA